MVWTHPFPKVIKWKRKALSQEFELGSLNIAHNPDNIQLHYQ